MIRGICPKCREPEVDCECIAMDIEHGGPSFPPLDFSNDVSHPKHYTNHPSGIECIQITEHMGFNLGNALKYIWRCDLKNDAIEDLNKAKWYIDREIERRSK